ncbi:bacteriochlorophyll 4-vinyl reductase [Elioraea sp.]|uniref:bacteriochlorophyll 4-vinyl reductase n=1 Tax=Elioraea sp. TaxID=2185103 RepID=UPI0025BDEFB2|nr:bacteriochlorophyll 4-vinyl reductase [Elioraea sp.]
MGDGAVAPAGTIDGLARAAEPRVGPNAITRIAEALRSEHDERVARAVFAAAGISGWLDTPPGAMVPECDVAALHRALVAALGERDARAVAASAGRRTAAFLLAHRIPGPVRLVLRLLPAAPSARLLMRVIGRHAWTFVGSGKFEASDGPPVIVTITGGPLRAAGAAAAGVAAYYAATFEALFRALVHPRTTVTARRRATEATASCVFALNWPA